MKSILKPFLSVLFLILLILNPALSVTGAARGLSLWGSAVVPALLPFMTASAAAVSLGGAKWICAPFYPVLNRLFHLSRPGSYVLVAGLLCGCPTGAKTAGEFYGQGRISLREARLLLAVCSQPSPMFILGYAAPQLKTVPSWLLPAALYAPLPLLAALASVRIPISRSSPSLQSASLEALKKEESTFSLDSQIASSFATMIQIGGYIVLFSMICSWIGAVPGISAPLRCALLGFLEITTGIQEAAKQLPPSQALILTGASLAFGGLSGLFQVKSVLSQATQKAGLSIRHYMVWKLLHSILTSSILIIWQMK